MTSHQYRAQSAATATTQTPTQHEKRAALYRMLWRWHFYAGLFCIPFVIILSLTGTLYLYKPQIETALDRPYMGLSFEGAPKLASQHVTAALESQPGSTLRSYELPQHANDAVQIVVATKGVDQLIYVHPQSLEILKSIPREDRLMAVVRTIHGELLMGDRGSLIVELAASWALVMVATGLYLWWPRTATGLAGVVWPRLKQGSKTMWRDVHAVTGVWVSFFAIFLIVSGLPWANVWGDGLKLVRQATGTQAQTQDWTQSRASEKAANSAIEEHSDHSAHVAAPFYLANIDDIVADARAAQLQPPVLIKPPGRDAHWVADSQPGNRFWRMKLIYSDQDGSRIGQEGFDDRHPIDKAIGIGIAVHEGQLFGPLNQIIGTLTALGLVLLSVSAFIMWRKRAPDGVLGAPPVIPDSRIGVGLGLMIFAFALLLPVLGISLIMIALLERLVLIRIPAARRWLGLAPATVKV